KDVCLHEGRSAAAAVHGVRLELRVADREDPEELRTFARPVACPAILEAGRAEDLAPDVRALDPLGEHRYLCAHSLEAVRTAHRPRDVLVVDGAPQGDRVVAVLAVEGRIAEVVEICSCALPGRGLLSFSELVVTADVQVIRRKPVVPDVRAR